MSIFLDGPSLGPAAASVDATTSTPAEASASSLIWSLGGDQQFAEFLTWTLGVAALTWIVCNWCNKSNKATLSSPADEYFCGGRRFSWYVITMSLFMTNISTEQLVGLNGQAFKDGCLVSSAWETLAGLSICLLALFFVPIYLELGLATTTGYLSHRYDTTTRTVASILLLLYYALVLCPATLYSAGLVLHDGFGFAPLFAGTVLEGHGLYVCSAGIGALGALYAIAGAGCRAVATGACLNGVGFLAVMGVMVPLAGFRTLKVEGFTQLFYNKSMNMLSPMRQQNNLMLCPGGDAVCKIGEDPSVVSVPWHVNFTGMMLSQLHYWCTNQVIVQRALAARSLEDAQKGVLLVGLLKTVTFAFCCVPGLIARRLVMDETLQVTHVDHVYPTLVREVMLKDLPRAKGLMAALVVGSGQATLASAVHSASTLFSLDIYKVYVNPKADDEACVRVAKRVGCAMALVASALAPLYSKAEVLNDLVQRFASLVSLPMILIVLNGMNAPLPDGCAARVGFFVGIITYGCLLLSASHEPVRRFIPASFMLERTSPYFLHACSACFLIALYFMTLFTRCFGLRWFCGVKQLPSVAEPLEWPKRPKVPLRRWHGRRQLVFAILCLVPANFFVLEISLIFGVVAFFFAWTFALGAFVNMPVELKLLEASFRCPNGHGELECLNVEEDGWKCAKCQEIIEHHAPMYQCWKCEYRICLTCTKMATDKFRPGWSWLGVGDEDGDQQPTSFVPAKDRLLSRASTRERLLSRAKSGSDWEQKSLKPNKEEVELESVSSPG